MFYWLFYEKLFHLYSPFRVFQYATFRIAMASLTALLLSMLLGPWLIARLRASQIGQHIREDGPRSHHKKAGTPTMGGLLIAISMIVPTLLWADLSNRFIWIVVLSIFSIVDYLLVIVGESDCGIGNGGKHNDPDEAVAEVGPEQRGHDHGNRDQQPAHRRCAGLFLVGFRSLFANELTDLELLQAANDDRPDDEAGKKSGQAGEGCAER